MTSSQQSPDFLALVVEDDPEFSRLIQSALQGLEGGWQTICVSTGRQALDLIEQADAPWVDLVLVDLGLPDLHGVDVIRMAHRRWPQAPVLVSSVHRSGADVLASIEAGARGYVDKSDTALTLSRAIDTVLKGEYPISASLAQHLFHLVPRKSAPHSGGVDETLSARELELLRLLGDGYTYEEASLRMDVSLNTVRTYSRRIFQKLEVHSKVQAITTAQTMGLL